VCFVVLKTCDLLIEIFVSKFINTYFRTSAYFCVFWVFWPFLLLVFWAVWRFLVVGFLGFLGFLSFLGFLGFCFLGFLGCLTQFHLSYLLRPVKCSIGNTFQIVTPVLLFEKSVLLFETI